MKAVRLIPAAALAACIVLTACSDYVGKEATHPLYAKYTTAKSAKSYREAAESLEEFLTICPKSPKAHYDAAMLYKENLEYYPAAIYHLQKYLDLSGETLSQQDKAAIRRYIQDCERMMFETYRVSNDIKLAGDVPQVDPAKLAAKNAENAALREKIQKYIENEKVILAQNQELRNRLDRLTSTVATTTKPAQSGSAASSASTASSTRGVPSSTTGTPGTTVAGENGVRYYYVAKGDGLQAIAQKMYGKASMWKVIQDANKEALGERGILKIGQRLVIPAVQQ
ncbi:MAG: LysM peptidoglycan-binding domain-containing protein [Lentisphaeria bacterium]|nr:LysM peptidoglycan-binding domain-containing protein [Lentisphaeria bacterium]